MSNCCSPHKKRGKSALTGAQDFESLICCALKRFRAREWNLWPRALLLVAKIQKWWHVTQSSSVPVQ